MNNILYLGDSCNSNVEWFWKFNTLFIQFLESKGITTKIINPHNKDNGFNYNQRRLFGYEIYYNLNNLIIANEKTKKCVLFTTFYNLEWLKFGFNNLPLDNIQAIYTGHYDQAIIERDWPEIKDKIKPWFFRPWRCNSQYLENCYNPTNNNIYFRGLLIPKVRDVLTKLNDSNIPGVDIKPGKSNNYLDEIKSCKVGFSMSGIRDMCNRDIELWQMGIPFIRPRFTSKIIVPIPDDTYIPVDWDCDYSYVTPIPSDIDTLASDIIEKFKEVKDNKKLLTQISKNGYNFYKDNFTMENIMHKSFEILEKENIL